jgi:hypothetical protein
VAVLVVDSLQMVHVDERNHKASAHSTRALNFAPQLLESDAAAPDAGELVRPRVLAIAGGFLAVARGELTVARGELAVTRSAPAVVRGAPTAHGRAGAKLLHTQSVPVKERVAVIELELFLVAKSGIVVALSRELVALLGLPVALAGEPVTRVLAQPAWTAYRAPPGATGASACCSSRPNRPLPLAACSGAGCSSARFVPDVIGRHPLSVPALP